MESPAWSDMVPDGTGQSHREVCSITLIVVHLISSFISSLYEFSLLVLQQGWRLFDVLHLTLRFNSLLVRWVRFLNVVNDVFRKNKSSTCLVNLSLSYMYRRDTKTSTVDLVVTCSTLCMETYSWTWFTSETFVCAVRKLGIVIG